MDAPEKKWLQVGSESNPNNPMGIRADRIIERTGEVSESIDYNAMIFRQIERTILSLNKSLFAFMINMELLEKMLLPFFDATYRLQNVTWNAKLSYIKARSINDDLKIDSSQYNVRMFSHYIEKFGFIMDTLGRRGLLPREDIEIMVGKQVDPVDDIYNPEALVESEKEEETVNPVTTSYLDDDMSPKEIIEKETQFIEAEPKETELKDYSADETNARPNTKFKHSP